MGVEISKYRTSGYNINGIYHFCSQMITKGGIMVKSGIIIGAVGFVLVLVSSVFISPVCAPCWGLILGLGAGYLAGVFDKPQNNNDAMKKGAIAGAIAAALIIIGALIGGVINASILEPTDLANMYEYFGLPDMTLDQTSIWIGQLGSAICCGLLNVGLMAGLGTAGGALWWQFKGKNQLLNPFSQY